MFLRLQIDNFAIIEHSRIEFHHGFSVLTGETGAGKSIIMDAISLLLGARAQKNMIRKNAESSSIQGVFMTKNKKALDFLEENRIPYEDVIIVERVLFRDRPSISEINGKTVTNALLREFGSIMALSGMQGENSFLIDPKFQLDLIDTFCGKEHLSFLKNLRQDVANYRALENKLHRESGDPGQTAREMDLLRYQIDEIESLALEPGEDESLREEFHAIRNQSSTLEYLKELSQMSFDDGGIRGLMDRFASSLEKVAQNDGSYGELSEEFEDIRYRFQEIAYTLRDRAENFEADPERLNEVAERLDAINDAKRKYGDSLEKIEEFLEASCDRLAYLEDYDQNIEDLKNQIEKIKEDADKKADSIRESRISMAKKVELRIAEVMKELDIPEAKFEIHFGEKALSEDGKDSVIYMVSTNKGEDLKPLSEVASGGEISRIFLAFISIYAEFDEREILILDEVDTGMSGKTAKVVAKKMAQLSKDRQLIVVSHLPQVVARGDRQYQITKKEENGRTVSVVKSLNKEERVAYLATMISGADTETTRKTAREMLEEHDEEVL
ncbi:DNA repair protein RecN [Aedoeadaptatus nemausensis]|uniref:DNA repair protein RecN n=1 Tax=Aedoeadaptatus nemausensis TaxID=2582829 RepID=A0A6V6XZZ9_9FIRM|nr:DNA repair protein RecN [Peptoniphilus nemausensis]CAC9925086.1 DNA repair protein RecN [Peptoniphilus nemausensis]